MAPLTLSGRILEEEKTALESSLINNCRLSRRRNLRKEGKVEDRISNLPDGVLCHILSFIPTKYAVVTSALSTRWKHLWKSVPNIEIDETPRFHGRNYINVPKTDSTSFLNFVDRVLSQNCSRRVKKFCIICVGEYNDHVDTWISAANSRDIEFLDLRLSCNRHAVNNLMQAILRRANIALQLLNSKNLVELRLQNMTMMNCPEKIYFPSVKKVYLSLVQFLDDDSLKNLISGCAILNELVIKGASWEWDNAQTLYVCLSTVDNLLLHIHKKFRYRVVIDAPNLRYLSITDHADNDYDLRNPSSLKSAFLDIKHNSAKSTSFDVFSDRLFELLKKISHVEDLWLASNTMNSFEYTDSINLPIFNNLTKLKLEIAHPHWLILPHVFKNSPNLVTFVFKKMYPHGQLQYGGCEFHEPSQSKCLLSSLETINITGFQGCLAEMEMLKFFLKNAMVLKTVSIHTYYLGREKKEEVLRQLMVYPKSSRTCRIGFSKSTDILAVVPCSSYLI